jgi:uracil-DNA glycosylase
VLFGGSQLPKLAKNLGKAQKEFKDGMAEANKPLPEERDACAPFLEREFAALTNAAVVVCLGQFGYQAARSHFGVRPRPKFGHGVEVPIEAGPTLVCSFHPSQQNTFTKRLTEPMLDAVFARALALSRSAG